MNERQAMDLTLGPTGDGGPTYFKIWMPYLFHRLEHPRLSHVFLPLNRNYKPLGQLSRDHVRYEDYLETHAVRFSRDPATFSGIWHNNEGSHFWLYDDGPKSRLDYFERLGRLMLKNPLTLTAKP